MSVATGRTAKFGGSNAAFSTVSGGGALTGAGNLFTVLDTALLAAGWTAISSTAGDNTYSSPGEQSLTVLLSYTASVGTFAAGDFVTGATSGATGTVYYYNSSGPQISLWNVVGTFSTSETIANVGSTHTGTTSAATGTESLFLHMKTAGMGSGATTDLSNGSYLLVCMNQWIDGSGNQWNEMGGTQTNSAGGAGYQYGASNIILPQSNTWDYGFVVDLNGVSVNVYSVYGTLAYTGSSGTFTANETILGSTSGATATLISGLAASPFVFTNMVGTFISGETLTGQTSAKTATSSTLTLSTPSTFTVLCGVALRPNGFLPTMTTLADYTFVNNTDTNIILSVNFDPVLVGYGAGSMVDVVSQQAGVGGTTYYTIGSPASGTFLAGETVKGNTSTHTGVLAYGWFNINSVGSLCLSSVSGAFTSGETVTGQTSGATISLSGVLTASALATMRQGAFVVETGLIGTIAIGTITGTFTAGNIVTGGTSGATGQVVSTITGSTSPLSLTNIQGTFQSGEVITDSVTPGHATSTGTLTQTGWNIVLDRLDRQNASGAGSQLLAGALIGENPQPIFGTCKQNTYSGGNLSSGTKMGYYKGATAWELVVSPNSGSSIRGLQPNSWMSQVNPSGLGGWSNASNTGNVGTLLPAWNPYANNFATSTYTPDIRTNAFPVSTADLIDVSAAAIWNMGTMSSRIYNSANNNTWNQGGFGVYGAFGYLRNGKGDFGNEHLLFDTNNGNLTETWMGPFPAPTPTITISSGSGTVGVILQGANIPSSPVTITVTWTTSDNNTASLLATAINGTTGVGTGAGAFLVATASSNTVTLAVTRTKNCADGRPGILLITTGASLTGTWASGNTVTGSSSGAHGTLAATYTSTSAAALVITNVTGIFKTSESLTTSAGGTTGTVTSSNQYYVGGGTITTGAITGTFTAGELIYGKTSGATAQLVNTTSPLQLRNITGIFQSGEVVVGYSSTAHATTSALAVSSGMGVNWAATGTGVTVNMGGGVTPGSTTLSGVLVKPYPTIQPMNGNLSSLMQAMMFAPGQTPSVVGQGYDAEAQYIYDRDTPAHDLGSGAARPPDAYNVGFN